MASIFPSVPRTPNPPGTSTPLWGERAERWPQFIKYDAHLALSRHTWTPATPCNDPTRMAAVQCTILCRCRFEASFNVHIRYVNRGGNELSDSVVSRQVGLSVSESLDPMGFWLTTVCGVFLLSGGREKTTKRTKHLANDSSANGNTWLIIGH